MSTPLVKKLGIKEGMTCIIKHSPLPYIKLVCDIPQSVKLKNRANGKVDFIHLFVQNSNILESEYFKLKKCLKAKGIFWISWLKGKKGISTDLTRDIIRDFGLANGLVDVKVCSINEEWSALKFVYRLIDRAHE